MHRMAALVLAFCCWTGGSSASAALVYNLEFAGVGFTAPGYSYRGGTFTIADGFKGQVSSSNVRAVFTDWSIDFRSPLNGGTSYTVTPSNSRVSYVDGSGAELTVNAKSIFFPDSDSGTLFFAGTQTVEYFPGGIRLDDLDFFSPARSFLPVPTTIATAVPEPTAGLLVSLSLVIGYAFQRRRRAAV